MRTQTSFSSAHSTCAPRSLPRPVLGRVPLPARGLGSSPGLCWGSPGLRLHPPPPLATEPLQLIDTSCPLDAWRPAPLNLEKLWAPRTLGDQFSKTLLRPGACLPRSRGGDVRSPAHPGTCSWWHPRAGGAPGGTAGGGGPAAARPFLTTRPRPLPPRPRGDVLG